MVLNIAGIGIKRGDIGFSRRGRAGSKKGFKMLRSDNKIDHLQVRGNNFRIQRHDFRSRRQPLPGFTLIELLVVIAIIALLVSILLPSLKRAKDLAKDVMCQSNVKNISTCLFLYTESYDGYTPLFTLGRDPNGDGLGNDSWISWPNIMTETEYTPSGQLGNYQPPLGIYICPKQPNPESKWGSMSDPFTRTAYTFGQNYGYYFGATHYALNSLFCSTNTSDLPDAGSFDHGFPQQKIAESKYPGSTFLLGDNSDNGGSCIYPPWGWPWNRSLALRHGNYDSCDMIFADGHHEVLEDRDYEYSYYNPDFSGP